MLGPPARVRGLCMAEESSPASVTEDSYCPKYRYTTEAILQSVANLRLQEGTPRSCWTCAGPPAWTLTLGERIGWLACTILPYIHPPPVAHVYSTTLDSKNTRYYGRVKLAIWATELAGMRSRFGSCKGRKGGRREKECVPANHLNSPMFPHHVFLLHPFPSPSADRPPFHSFFLFLLDTRHDAADPSSLCEPRQPRGVGCGRLGPLLPPHHPPRCRGGGRRCLRRPCRRVAA